MLLQSADGRAGAPVAGRGLSWPRDLRATRREELDAAPERAVEAARRAGAAALLFPGGLWDPPSAPPAVVERVFAALSSFPGAVFVAPAPGDVPGPGGFWEARTLAALGLPPVPPNVVVFDTPEWRTVPIPGREDVSVTGRAAGGDESADPSRAKGRIRILVAWEPDAARRRDWLHRTAATWGAFGGGTVETIAAGGVPRGADAGSPCGLGAADAGPRRFLRVTLRAGAAPAVEPVPSDPRTIHDLVLALGVADADGVLDRAEAFLSRAGVRPADVVRLTVTGPRPAGAAGVDTLLAPLAARAAHLEVRDRTESPDLGEPPDERNAEGRFLAALLRIRAASEDAWSRRVAELALEIGRDALASRGLAPPPAGEEA